MRHTMSLIWQELYTRNGRALRILGLGWIVLLFFTFWSCVYHSLSHPQSTLELTSVRIFGQVNPASCFDILQQTNSGFGIWVEYCLMVAKTRTKFIICLAKIQFWRSAKWKLHVTWKYMFSLTFDELAVAARSVGRLSKTATPTSTPPTSPIKPTVIFPPACSCPGFTCQPEAKC